MGEGWGEGPDAPAHPAPPASHPERHVAIPEKLIYQHLNFTAERGQRIVLVGPNGAGKSTLLKLLAHQLKPQAGERKLGHNVKAGYYAQHRLAMLDISRTVLEEALETPQRVSEQFVRTVLGSFLFRGDDVFKSVSILSGGEKSRLALVKLLLDPPNLLLMDEPTTHLDLASVDALIEALKPFEGTLVFISHDVHFIRALATHVVRVENGVLKHFPGGYDYYLDKTAQSARAGLTAGTDPAMAIKALRKPAGLMPDRKVEKRKEAELRQARSRQKREIQERIAGLEKEIADLESRQKELVAQLESPDTYAKPGRAMEVNRELMDIHDRLALVMSNWEKASTELAQVENDS
jgi:ATP-binding cassette subfamily F protein 3